VIDSGALKTITDGTFRANPDYEIILIDRLPEVYRKEFEDEVERDPDLYGVLWPRADKGLTPKTLCHETALLLYSLRDAGALPAYVRARLGGDCNQAIAELVLDGVLEIVDDGKGNFVSGPTAHDLIYQEDALELGVGRIADLSREALRYGQLVGVNGSAQLSARLYCYNTIPISPQWRTRLPTPAAAESFLGIRGNTPLRRLLERHWARVGDGEGSGGWLMWRLRNSPPKPTTADPDRRYKFYVSPTPEALPKAWPTIVDIFAERQVPAFKVGRDAAGLLRPDKIVAYFDSFEELAALSARLQAELADCPAQGTPFSAGVDDTGLLSWGMDPPSDARMPGWSLPESWRLWITNRLAVALIAAKSGSVNIEPWQFALQRLRIEGVDTKTWAPNQQVWSEKRSM
jgi:hypothetical protein